MPSFNPERAEVPLTLADGRTVKLCLDFQAVGALKASLGDSWDTEISTALGAYDCPKICAVLEILAAKHHGDMTAADFMAASPPWMRLVNALNAAQSVFLFGHAGPPEPQEEEAEHKEGEDGEEGEERPFANGQDGAKSSSRRWHRLMQRVYGHRSSGA